MPLSIDHFSLKDIHLYISFILFPVPFPLPYATFLMCLIATFLSVCVSYMCCSCLHIYIYIFNLCNWDHEMISLVCLFIPLNCFDVHLSSFMSITSSSNLYFTTSLKKYSWYLLKIVRKALFKEGS